MSDYSEEETSTGQAVSTFTPDAVDYADTTPLEVERRIREIVNLKVGLEEMLPEKIDAASKAKSELDILKAAIKSKGDELKAAQSVLRSLRMAGV